MTDKTLAQLAAEEIVQLLSAHDYNDKVAAIINRHFPAGPVAFVNA